MSSGRRQAWRVPPHLVAHQRGLRLGTLSCRGAERCSRQRLANIRASSGVGVLLSGASYCACTRRTRRGHSVVAFLCMADIRRCPVCGPTAIHESDLRQCGLACIDVRRLPVSCILGNAGPLARCASSRSPTPALFAAEHCVCICICLRGASPKESSDSGSFLPS